MSLLEAFSTINDYRASRNRWYGLASLLVVYTLAILSNCGTLRGCAQFCQRHREALMQRFGWSCTPSFSTFSLMLRSIDVTQLHAAFSLWMQEQSLTAETLCVDGKTLGGTVSAPHSPVQDYAHTVQLFGQQSGRIHSCGHGRDEVASLLALVMRLPGGISHTFTADALYTRAVVTRALRQKGHHYLLCVKANQPKLLAAITSHTLRQQPAAEVQCTERNRGRCEERTLHLWPATFACDAGWSGIATVLRVQRRRNQSRETLYYISSLPPDTHAQLFADTIRGHWHIENKFHYVKDVVFGEDKSRIRSENAPYNAATLRNAAFNLAKSFGTNSITQTIRAIAHDIHTLLNIPKLITP